jgi:hypothetical protein
MKRPPRVTALTGAVADPESATQKYDGDKIAREILGTDDGAPLPTAAISQLTRAWERLMESNPETFPLMHATMAVLERINTVGESRDVVHGQKPAALWKSLGFKGGSGRGNGQREFAIRTLVDMYESKYFDERPTAPGAALSRAIAKVAKLAGVSTQVINNLRRKYPASELDWEPVHIPRFEKLLADSITPK